MKKIKALLKSKAGMTFVELITALALLVIIITSFTPMLLDSYEWLYKAGEKNEKTYEAKSTMEQELAERDSNVLSRYSLDFGVKLENTAQVIFLNMRKAMENVQNGIQTVFYGGKGTIRVVSPNSIPDDEPTKEITILFNGINVTSTVVGDITQAKREKNESTGKWDYQVAVQVIPPKFGAATGDDKTAFDPDHALSADYCTVSQPVMKDGKAYSDITVSGDIDVLTTVLKIVAYYKDENDELNSAEAYVRITPPTIMIVGGTTDGISYYTSKGVDKKTVVVEEKDENENTIYKNEIQTGFKAYGRPLREENLPAGGETYKTAGIDTEFLSVNYIDNDNANNIEPYYVLTGTNGVIQRLFIARGNINEVSKVTGYGTDKIRSIEYKDGGLTKKLYHAFWGGDVSHQFGFSTYKESSSYGSDDDDCWYTQDSNTKYKGSTDFDRYGVQTRMAMFYNGYGIEGGGYDEIHRNGRKISYVIMEKGSPLRLTGIREANASNSWGGFITTWEYPQIKTLWNDGHLEDWSYPNQVFSDQKAAVRTKKWFDTDGWDSDSLLSYLNLKSYGNLGVAMLFDIGDGDENREDRLSHEKATELNVTASFYNPAHKNGDGSFGKMMYLGSSVAYAYLQQVDNTNKKEDYANRYQFYGTGKKNIPEGSITGYLIQGNINGGTTVKKASGGGDWETAVNALKTNPSGTEKTKREEFYVQRPGTSVTRLELSDVDFTLGYSSNREQVFANVTYGSDKKEYHNSYERYYNLSHYGDLERSNRDNNTYVSTIVNDPKSYINSTANDMYNVWFPGEFYNLTQTATKEGITVAVGYTVSGSTYQWVNSDQKTNTSTALGSVYNDGVLAVMPSQNESFQNVLYFKDTADFENSNITSNTNVVGNYDDQFTTYGTHGRRSVRFTAVDICVDGGNVTQTQRDKTYYAVYGDNHGRVYISKIASVSMPSEDIGNPNNPGEDGVGSNNPVGTGNLVTGIKDLATSNTNGTDNDPNAGYKDAEMNEMLDTKGNRLSEHFSEIVSIFVDEQTIYVTGRGNGTKDPMIAVCNINEGFKFTVITLVHNAASYNINDMMVLGGYLYGVGEDINRNIGFWIALDTEILNSCVKNGYDSIAKYATKHVEKYKGVAESAIQSINPAADINLMPYQELATPLNSIAGRNT